MSSALTSVQEGPINVLLFKDSRLISLLLLLVTLRPSLRKIIRSHPNIYYTKRNLMRVDNVVIG